MRISIIGAGVVGEATGKGFLVHEHEVCFCDENQIVLNRLERDSLRVSKVAEDADIYFICTHEKNVPLVVGQLHEKKGLIVVRSTTRPGTVSHLMKMWKLHICHNPEFLREKHALSDFLHPSRIVIGECCKKHGDMLENLYRPFRSPIIRTTSTISELTKLACNSYLACTISYWNEIDRIVKRIVDEDACKIVRQVAVLDKRIPTYGTGFSGKFGGKCLPKDLNNLIKTARTQSLEVSLLKAVREVNVVSK